MRRSAREFLRVLTILTFICGISLLGLTLHLILSTGFQSITLALLSLGICIVLVSVLGFQGTKQDKSRLLVVFFYLDFLLAILVFISSYTCFFFREMMKIWVKHHWTADILQDLRQTTCCTTYSDTIQYLQHRLLILGIIELISLLLLLTAMYCVIRIIKVPIVMRSILAVINTIYMLLGTGLFIFGVLLQVYVEITSRMKWIGVVFIIVATLMLALPVLGIIGSKSKSRSLLLIYITGLGCCFIALMICSVSALSFSNNLASTYNAHTSSTLACDIDLPGCTNCTDVVSDMIQCEGVTRTFDKYWVSCNGTSLSSNANTSSTNSDCFDDMTVLNAKADQGYEPNDIAKCGKCPEWSASDVQAYIRNTLHLIGLFALVVCLFVIVGFIGALVLRRSLVGYQTDSI